jgi:hypothetical protein
MIYIKRTAAWLQIIFVLIVALSAPLTVYAQRGLNVAVIAHSISTRVEARKVMQRQGWSEAANLRQADAILVVCRSGLNWPLSSSYRTIKELDDDADSQLNISGANFHIYIYQINNNLGVDEVKHVHFPAND